MTIINGSVAAAWATRVIDTLVLNRKGLPTRLVELGDQLDHDYGDYYLMRMIMILIMMMLTLF